MDQEKIKAQAKSIMDNFMGALGSIDVESEYLLNRDITLREDCDPKKPSEEFRQAFLKNAPQTKSDAIVTVKGTWVE